MNNDSNIIHISKKMSTFLFIFLHQPLYYLTIESCTPPVHDLNTDKHNYLDLGGFPFLLIMLLPSAGFSITDALRGYRL